MNHIQELKNNEEIFFGFYKEKYSLFLNSNIFLRDIQYAIASFFDQRNIKVKYAEAEVLAKEFTNELVNENKLKVISDNTWLVLHEFVKPVIVEEETTEENTEPEKAEN